MISTWNLWCVLHLTFPEKVIKEMMVPGGSSFGFLVCHADD